MANSPTPTIPTLLVLGLALLCAGAPSAAQNCGCEAGYCCSENGYCGTTSAYCGNGCKSGPCTGGGAAGGGGADVASVVTDAFFNGIKSQNDPGCKGQGFYMRQAFMDAANKYSDFAHGGSEVDGKHEIAAFFAHVAHGTGRMCSINEKNGASKNYCDPSYTQWPCAPGKMYYGRGPLQISYNYNYGATGEKIGFDGLQNQEIVAKDSRVSFETALWFCITSVHTVMQQQGSAPL